MASREALLAVINSPYSSPEDIQLAERAIAKLDTPPTVPTVTVTPAIVGVAQMRAEYEASFADHGTTDDMTPEEIAHSKDFFKSLRRNSTEGRWYISEEAEATYHNSPRAKAGLRFAREDYTVNDAKWADVNERARAADPDVSDNDLRYRTSALLMQDLAEYISWRWRNGRPEKIRWTDATEQVVAEILIPSPLAEPTPTQVAPAPAPVALKPTIWDEIRALRLNQ